MEIEVILRMQVNTPDYIRAEQALRDHVNNKMNGFYVNDNAYRLHFHDFYFMASQPIDNDEDEE